MTTIPGTILITEFITQHQHDWLVQKIDTMPWNDALKRKTQHYGWQYRYDRSPLIRERDYLGELPEWLKRLSAHLTGWPPVCNQVIINNYEPGQKIGKHTDHLTNFGSVIITLSLGSEGVLVFRNSGNVIEIPVQPRSLLIMTGESRYKWTHELKPVKARRVSITFRQVV